MTGGPTEPPTKSGLSLVDFSGGYLAAVAILGGVWQARRDGVGCDADLSLFETALAPPDLYGDLVRFARLGAAADAELGHQTMVPFQAFEAADGWLVVACPKETLWRSPLRRARRDRALADDERFAEARGARRATVTSSSPGSRQRSPGDPSPSGSSS